MVDRVSFSGQEISLDDIANFHSDVQDSLFEFFAGNSERLFVRHDAGKIGPARDRALAELDKNSCLAVLASVEAAIRIDYLRRSYARWRDPLSKAMRALYREKKHRVSLEDDLIRLWKEKTSAEGALFGELVGAFKYRHWLAHGRYWTPKLGKKYDYESIFGLAGLFLDEMQLHGQPTG